MKERIAQQGHWLTQANIENEEIRIFVSRVSGFGDLDNLYTEWTDEQKQQWEAEHPIEELDEIGGE